MRISDWSSDVCSSDLHCPCSGLRLGAGADGGGVGLRRVLGDCAAVAFFAAPGAEVRVGADVHLAALVVEDDLVEEAVLGAAEEIGRESGRERVCTSG